MPVGRPRVLVLIHFISFVRSFIFFLFRREDLLSFVKSACRVLTLGTNDEI